MTNYFVIPDTADKILVKQDFYRRTAEGPSQRKFQWELLRITSEKTAYSQKIIDAFWTDKIRISSFCFASADSNGNPFIDN